MAPNRRREFWRDTVLNRSDAVFRPDAAAHGFSASVRGFLGGSAELRDGNLDAGILRRGVARCRQDGGDEILLPRMFPPPKTFHIRTTAARSWFPAAGFC